MSKTVLASYKGQPPYMPVGFIFGWPVAKDPDGFGDKWLECKGQTVTAAEGFADLVKYLAGDSEATEAKLPNYQGLFMRGFGSQSHIQENGSLYGETMTRHSSDLYGRVQGDGIRNITGNLPIGDSSSLEFNSSNPNYYIRGVFTYFTPSNVYGLGGSVTTNRVAFFNASRVVPVANEDRPVNTAIRWMIRARN